MNNLGADITDWTSNADVGGRDVFFKAHQWQIVPQLEGLGIYPYFQALDKNEGPVATFRGKEVIMLGSNNYLGLTTHPEVKAAAQQAIEQFGTSMTGSRFVNGTLTLHEELENKLAKFYGKEAGLVFTTGYQTNLGVMTALLNKSSVVLVDKRSHASLHDGIKLSSSEVVVFKHADCDDLSKKLSAISHNKGILIAVDGVFSGEGDLSPLPQIIELAKRYEARLLVDEAHGLGVMGPQGGGAVNHFGVEQAVDLIVGTFSKSLASVGGFVVGSKDVINFIKHFGRSMIFSASLPPPCIAAASKALDILIAEPERVLQVRKNAAWMKEGLKEIGYNVGPSESAVLPIIVGDELRTFCIWKDLIDAGVYTNPFLYPAVARGEGTLRTSYLATHEPHHLERALESFRKIAKNYDIESAA